MYKTDRRGEKTVTPKRHHPEFLQFSRHKHPAIWVELFHSNFICEFPTLSSLNVILLRLGLYRDNEVKITSLVQALIQYNCGPYQRENLDTDILKGRKPHEDS